MPKKALFYAWSVVIIGVAVLACAGFGWRSSNSTAFVVCLGLAGLAATFKMRLPKLTGTLSPAFVFVLVAAATLSWSETVAIAAISGIVQCVWFPKNRPTALQVAFNAAALAISSGIAYGIAPMMMVSGGKDMLVAGLGAAGVALLVSNTLIISMILCLIKEASFMTAWRSVQLWAVPYYLAGGLLANIWSRTQFTPGLAAMVLAAVSAYVMSIVFRELGALVVRADAQGSCPAR